MFAAMSVIYVYMNASPFAIGELMVITCPKANFRNMI